MPDTTIFRGDSYANRRPLFRYELVDDEGGPFNLAECTVRTTFKAAPTNPQEDADDATAAIKGTLIVNGAGSPTTEDHLFLVGAAANGVCELRLTAEDTLALPTGQVWHSDVELTDADGEVFTFVFTDGLTAVDGYTNRTVG